MLSIAVLLCGMIVQRYIQPGWHKSAVAMGFLSFFLFTFAAVALRNSASGNN